MSPADLVDHPLQATVCTLRVYDTYRRVTLCFTLADCAVGHITCGVALRTVYIEELSWSPLCEPVHRLTVCFPAW